MSNYGHSINFFITNGSTSDTVTWNGSNGRWEGSSFYLHEHFLNPNTRSWAIRNYGNTILSTTSAFSIYAIGSNSPDSLTWSNSWTVSEPTTTSTTTSEPAGTNPPPGGQGDPHIQPFFGKKYTI